MADEHSNDQLQVNAWLMQAAAGYIVGSMIGIVAMMILRWLEVM